MILSAKQGIERVIVENKIQKLLLDFEEKLSPFKIDYVEIDTREFANMRTEIYLKSHYLEGTQK